jgi:hypothetical protein
MYLTLAVGNSQWRDKLTHEMTKMLLENPKQNGKNVDLTSLVFAVLATALVVAVIALPLVMVFSSAGGVPNLALSICSFSGPIPSAPMVR